MWKRFAGGFALVAGLNACAPYLEAPQTVPRDRLVYAEQGWSAAEREGFYTRPQGTVMFPAKWFLALEEWNGDTLISDRDNLNRYGFLTDGVVAGEGNPYGLPVGFTLLKMDLTGQGEFQEVVGVGCAACHTGQLNYQGKGLRVDGGSALANFATFQKRLALAVASNYYLPWKWSAFRRRVLGENATEAQKEALRAAFKTGAVDAAVDAIWTAQRLDLYPVPEGYGRLDALQRIANTLLADDLKATANNRQVDAPVHLPPLWHARQYDWVQYNGSVRQAMIRNVGEALGVRAQTYFVKDGKPVPPTDPDFWASTIPVRQLRQSEEDLGRLHPPVWDDKVASVLGSIDAAAAARGAELYRELCIGCHAPRRYTISFQGRPVQRLELPTIPVEVVGTDPAAMRHFIDRRYDATPLGVSYPISAGEGLQVVTELIKQYQYQHGNDRIQPAAPPVPPADRAEFDGYGQPNQVRAPCGYKARPLVGIWAQPPYLHNGSVPTLYDLLSPLAERPAVFPTGSREYDPRKGGYALQELAGASRVDTTETGNGNGGHLFSDRKGAGVIGRALSPAERFSLVEFLKSMKEDTGPILDGGPDNPWVFPCNQMWAGKEPEKQY